MIAKAPQPFRGVRALLILPMVPLGQPVGFAVGFPGYWVLNMDVNHLVKWIGVGAGIAIGLFVMDSLLRSYTGKPQLGATTPDHAEAPEPARTPVSATGS